MKRKRRQIGWLHRNRKGLICLGLSVWLLASCSLSRRSKYMIDVAEPSSTQGGWPRTDVRFKESQNPVLRVAYPRIADAEYVNADQLCMTCHQTYAKTFAHNVHRGQKCEDCHGPASRHLSTRGKVPGLILNFNKLKKAERSEVCLKCHQQDQCEPNASWRTSVHAHNGVACTDCHNAHYNVPPGTPAVDPQIAATGPVAKQVDFVPDAKLQIEDMASSTIDQEFLRATSNHLGAVTPQICYQCHSSMQQYEKLAHPHQIMGSKSFTCDTCHDPHGSVRQETRSDLCVQCHNDAPTMAWHSSTHSLNGVACTDCHNPHPDTMVEETVGIKHTNLIRPKRMPMSVQDPQTCYKCHPKVYAQNAMPSHHPIKEGKMVCSDCHDGHGQTQGNLKEATVNQLCYRCHADLQGPFVYEHSPVAQDCSICHNPHGAVANNLLHQPATFLCLRCHSGHRVGPTSGAHTFAGLPDTGTDVGQQRAFFSDCTECHAQIHGSNLPSPNNPHALLR